MKKSSIMNVAFLLVTALECKERLDDGEGVAEAIGGTIERGRIRARAMKRAGRQASRQIKKLEES